MEREEVSPSCLVVGLDAIEEVGALVEEADALVDDGGAEAFVDEDADGVLLGVADAAHGVGDLVAESFGRDDGDLLADALVGVEVEGELGVVLVDDDLGSLSIFSVFSFSQ